MKPFLLALVYEIGSIVCFGCVLREIFTQSRAFHYASGGAVLMLIVSGTVLFAVALNHVKQGVINLSNKRKMRLMAKRVASDVLRASGRK